MRQRSLRSILCAAVLAAAAARAEEPVRVYTNADLEPLPEAAAPSTPAPAESLDGWAFVAEHLAREQARLEAQRQYDLDRQLLASPAEPPSASYSLPYTYWWPFVDDGHGRHDRRGKRGLHHAVPDHPRPIHAGPTQAMLMREQAKRLSGADAFPDAPKR